MEFLGNSPKTFYRTLGISASPVVSLTAETLDFQARITQVGAIKSSSLTVIDDYILGCKNDGIWDLLLDVGVFAGNNLPSSLVKLKYPTSLQSTLTNFNFVEGDYSESKGLKGDGLSKVLDTGFILSSHPELLGACGVCIYITAGKANDQSTQIGAEWVILAHHYSASTTYYSAQGPNSHAVFSEANSSVLGLQSFDHTGNTTRYYRNGHLTDTEQIGFLYSDQQSFYILGRNRAEYPQRCPRTVGFYAIKKGMSVAQEAALYNRVHALMIALGRAV